MIGLLGGRRAMPANPRLRVEGTSPDPNASRSMPEQNVSPWPVMIATRTSSDCSTRSMAAPISWAVCALRAFLTCGRWMVITVTPSAVSTPTTDLGIVANRREPRDAEATVRRMEYRSDIQANPQLVGGRPDDIRHDARPLGELDVGQHIGRAGELPRSPVNLSEAVDRATAQRLDPLGGGIHVRDAERARRPHDFRAGDAASDHQSPLAGALPVGRRVRL